MTRAGVLTVSTRGAAGEREDTSGALIAAWVKERGWELAARAVVPDDTAAIVRVLVSWADADGLDLIITTGGTGIAAFDVTPEATGAVIERAAPGIAEYLRWRSFATFPRAALSRGAAGVRGRTLVVNLPGSPGGVKDGLAALAEFADHAVQLLRGDTEH